jgi:hypothetical protein
MGGKIMPIDYKKYPKNWLSEIRPKVLKRSNNKCEICGIENYTTVYSVKFYIRENGKYGYRAIWFRCRDDAVRAAYGNKIKSVKVVLTIAHLDHDELNHDVKLERLKAMCQYCHLKYDAKEKYLRKVGVK